ncbi:tRNA (adenosine(37)-N6)-dimethylallyltransferase MiaA [Candidatus Daviesbacteria bacterium]|nr:tRNA (adenosine(37)-N6)-dimethylallyltransferase MiaA [Candidatus Daviesbacteria bacterium]
MQKLLVILGPTSTGKTDLALRLAKKFNGELVACDSRQVYTGLDIGTGKLPGQEVTVRKGKGLWEMDGVKVWMYDVADSKKQHTVYNYVKDANKVIDSIVKRGKLPIVVGGTGLYLKALLEGLPNLAIPIDLKLRKKLEKLSLEELQKKLQEIASKRWEEMNNSDRQNPRRLIRAIEILQNSKVKIQKSKLQLKIQNYHTLKIGLMAPREVLYQRIDQRVVDRINQGMIDEAEKLHKNGLSLKRMRQLGLEYGGLADFLEGKIQDQQKLIKILQGKIHGYARRQITWFKKEKNVIWFDITH